PGAHQDRISFCDRDQVTQHVVVSRSASGHARRLALVLRRTGCRAYRRLTREAWNKASHAASPAAARTGADDWRGTVGSRLRPESCRPGWYGVGAGCTSRAARIARRARPQAVWKRWSVAVLP